MGAAVALYERTGLLVTQVHSVDREPFACHYSSMQAICHPCAERDLIVTEDGRRWNAQGEEITE